MNKYFEHFKTISRHRFLVFKLCFKSGLFYRGLVHDLSKYSPTEFLESGKYYTTDIFSPIQNCKKDLGYSLAWINHTSKNKHHFEHWYDPNSILSPVMPYKYAVEMICDRVAAGMNYKKSNFNNSSPYEYFITKTSKNKYMINDKVYDFMERVFIDLKDNGMDFVFNKKYFKKTYKKIIGDVK